MSTKQDHKRWRKAFNAACLKRDKNKCKICGWDEYPEELDVHHITPRKEMPNGGYVLENGITLCPDCHLDAEDALNLSSDLLKKMRKEKVLKGVPLITDLYGPKKLYKLIGSTKTKAITASKRLK